MRLVGLGTPVRGVEAGGVISWQGSVKDKDLTAPPGSPSTGDRYIVASVATGAWAGEENNIAEWTGSAWTFDTPEGGWAVWIEDESEIYVFNGSSWNQESLGPHAATHQNGGADEVSVAGLSGLLGDNQNPAEHATSHRGAGSDEIDAATESRAGLMASADKSKLDGVSAGAEKYVDRGDPSAYDGSIAGGLTADGTWRLINLGSIGVPAEAASKLIHLRCRVLDDAVESAFMFRKAGNSNEINVAKGVTVVSNDYAYFEAWVMCTAERQIEYKIDTGVTEVGFVVAGWMA